jgi:methionine-rich copper-binding protein CopC
MAFTAASLVAMATSSLGNLAVAQTNGAHHGGHQASMEMRPSIAEGAVLTTRPDKIDISFTPAMRLIAARLTTATGETIPVRFDAAAPATALATIRFASLAPDSYTFTYTSDMGDHTMSGRVRFTVR